MAKQEIIIGTAANEQASDTLRAGAIKINSNFTELYDSNATVFDRLIAGTNITLTKSNGECTIDSTIPEYVLPNATSSTLGGVKVDGKTIFVRNGVISSNGGYILQPATSSTLGGVKVDGKTIRISNGIITATSVTGNSDTVTNGVYTTGSYANPPWITSLSYAKITNAPAAYSLPVATTEKLGGVKVDGTTISITNGVIRSIVGLYKLQPASTSTLGGVKIGSGLQIDVDGVISATAPTNITGNAETVTNGVYTSFSYSNPSWISALSYSKLIDVPDAYSLPVASADILGGIKIGDRLAIDENGVLSATVTEYTLPTASNNEKGGIMVGAGLTISNGTLSANVTTSYSLPTASDSVIGGVKIGDGLMIEDGRLSATGSGPGYGSVSKVDALNITTTGSTISSSVENANTTPVITLNLPTASSTITGVLSADDWTTFNNKQPADIIASSTVSGILSFGDWTAFNSKLSAVPIASDTILGGVKIGSGLQIDVDGVISATGGSGGSGVLSRTSVAEFTGLLAPGATIPLRIVGFKGYMLYKVQVSAAAWVRIYTSNIARTADAARVQTTDPTTPGVIAEVITSAANTVLISPGVIGFNDDTPVTTGIYLAVTNNEPADADITVILTLVQLES